jgi:hypothetical protein
MLFIPALSTSKACEISKLSLRSPQMMVATRYSMAVGTIDQLNDVTLGSIESRKAIRSVPTSVRQVAPQQLL